MRERATRRVGELVPRELESLLETATQEDATLIGRPSLVEQLGHSTSDASGASRFELGEVVGKGGMGVVYAALDRDLGRQVAWKQVRPDPNKPARRTRFLREARLTGQLEHPAIPPVYEVGLQPGGRLYYVMRFVHKAQTLRALIDRLIIGDADALAYWTIERRVRVIQHVAQALHYAHCKGVIHRDVKPENIMVGQYGQVYLVDWGLAKVVEALNEDEQLTRMGALTTPGAIVGSPLYLSPEQVVGQADARSDLYSLCTVLYEFLVLRHPIFDVAPPDMPELVTRLTETIPEPAARFGPVPAALSMICARGLLKSRTERYQTCNELEQELQNWIEGNGPVVCGSTWAISLVNRLRRRLDARPHQTLFTLLIAFGLLLLCSLLGAIAFAMNMAGL